MSLLSHSRWHIPISARFRREGEVATRVSPHEAVSHFTAESCKVVEWCTGIRMPLAHSFECVSSPLTLRNALLVLGLHRLPNRRKGAKKSQEKNEALFLDHTRVPLCVSPYAISTGNVAFHARISLKPRHDEV
ncbi:hypothetical protein P5V15_000697 [Pogonomyrmex californicus]